MSESRKVEKKRKFSAIQYILEFNRIVIQDLEIHLVHLQLSDALNSPVIRAGHNEGIVREIANRVVV